MKKGSLANVALCLAPAAWMLVIYGSLAQMGDPSPAIPVEKIIAQRRVLSALLLIGLASLLVCGALAFYVRAQAKWRARAIAVVLLLPMLLMGAFALG